VLASVGSAVLDGTRSEDKFLDLPSTRRQAIKMRRDPSRAFLATGPARDFERAHA